MIFFFNIFSNLIKIYFWIRENILYFLYVDFLDRKSTTLSIDQSLKLNVNNGTLWRILYVQKIN